MSVFSDWFDLIWTDLIWIELIWAGIERYSIEYIGVDRLLIWHDNVANFDRKHACGEPFVRCVYAVWCSVLWCGEFLVPRCRKGARNETQQILWFFVLIYFCQLHFSFIIKINVKLNIDACLYVCVCVSVCVYKTINFNAVNAFL